MLLISSPLNLINKNKMVKQQIIAGAITDVEEVGLLDAYGNRISPSTSTDKLLAQNDLTSAIEEIHSRQKALFVNNAHARGMDFYTAVGLGLVPGFKRATALGNNPDVSQGSVPEDSWFGGGIYPWLYAATTLKIRALGPEDSAAGIGARTVLVNGLDSNYNEISEVVTLNGISDVTLTLQYLRIQSALIMSAGTNKINFTNIEILDTATSTVRAVIPAGVGITRQAIFTVPAGYTMSMHSMYIGINRFTSAANITVATMFQSPNGYYRLPVELSSDGAPYRHEGIPGIIVNEKNDISLRCVYASANNINMTAAFLGVLCSNSLMAAA